jgi:hypothetical protein
MVQCCSTPKNDRGHFNLGLKKQKIHIWNISELGLWKWQSTVVNKYKTMHCFEKNNLIDKITPTNKRNKICSRVCQCMSLGDYKFCVLLSLQICKGTRVIVFPLDKNLKPIPWNDWDFNVVMEPMLGCDMREALDTMLLNGLRGGDCTVSFKAWIKSLSFEAKNGSLCNVSIGTTSTTTLSS